MNQLFAAKHRELSAVDPDLRAMVFPDRTFTHGQLARLGEAFAHRMREHGIGRTSRVTLRSPEPLLTLATILGCSWLGAAFVPFAGEGNTPADLAPTHVLFSSSIRTAPTAGAIEIDGTWSPALTGPLEIADETAGDPDADWLWVHTSGTTGLPKYLGLSQNMVVGRSLAVADEFRRGSRHVLLAHVNSRPFLARAAAALLNLSELHFELAPEQWAGSGIDGVHGSRSLIQSVLGSKTLGKRLPRVELQGSKLPDEEALALLHSFEVVDDTYGASETSKSYSTLWTIGASGRAATKGVVRDSQIELVEADGTKVAKGEIGAVRVRNPYMARSYLNDPVATSEAFRDGWFYPGDMARQDSDGRLHFLDRKETVINLFGAKFNALFIDRVMRSTQGITDAICFKNPKPGAKDELFAFVVFDEAANRLQATASLRFALSEQFGDLVVPRVIQPVNQVPRRPDGTPDRAECAAMVLRVAPRN